MHLDVEEFVNFYQSPLGKVVAKILSRQLFYISDLNPRMKVLGVGFSTPYLASFQKYVERTIAVMPPEQGVIFWPSQGKNLSVLAHDQFLPFPDQFFDVIYVVHALEFSEDPAGYLRELSRVLSPTGKIFVVVPNRKGFWASFAQTPFGHGKPYTTKQLRSLLERTNFTFLKRHRALFFPPLRWPVILRAAATWEKAGTQFYRAFSGLIVIEAEKNPVEIPLVKVKQRVFIEKPVLGHCYECEEGS